MWLFIYLHFLGDQKEGRISLSVFQHGKLGMLLLLKWNNFPVWITPRNGKFVRCRENMKQVIMILNCKIFREYGKATLQIEITPTVRLVDLRFFYHFRGKPQLKVK